jgi:hypothetical protein
VPRIGSRMAWLVDQYQRSAQLGSSLFHHQSNVDFSIELKLNTPSSVLSLTAEWKFWNGFSINWPVPRMWVKASSPKYSVRSKLIPFIINAFDLFPDPYRDFMKWNNDHFGKAEEADNRIRHGGNEKLKMLFMERQAMEERL